MTFISIGSDSVTLRDEGSEKLFIFLKYRKSGWLKVVKNKKDVEQSFELRHTPIGETQNIRQTRTVFPKQTVSRRNILRFIGGASVVSLLGCLNESSTTGEAVEKITHSSESNSSQTEQLNCFIRPQQTEGPYFIDERLNRSDIRTDPLSGSRSQGIPLRLTLQVFQLNNEACIPLEGAIVDIWHCDALGVYSDVIDQNFNTKGQQFLRGFQTTNSEGIAEFITIYPGWYPGRAVHIHFKIRTHENRQSGYEFTSQLYFDGSLSNQIYAQAPYNQREQNMTPNELDGIFQFGGEQLTLQTSEDEDGYRSQFKIGLKLNG